MPCGVELSHRRRRPSRNNMRSKVSVYFCVQLFWHKYWIGAPKTRAKITIFQTSVFQLFMSLLYRRTKEHIFLTRTGAEIYGYTEWNRIIGSTYLHVSSRKISYAKGRGAICSFVLMSNILSHTEYTEYTEKSPRIFTYLSVCFLATNGR